MKKIKHLYLVSPDISYKTFKNLNDQLVKDSGPTPKEGDRILWEMIRDKQILAWFCDELTNDMGIGLVVPPAEKVSILKSP